MTSAAGYTELCTLSGLPGFGTAMPSGQRAAAANAPGLAVGGATSGFGTAMPSGQRAAAANAPGLAVGGATSGMPYEHAVIIFLLLRLQHFFYVYSFLCS